MKEISKKCLCFNSVQMLIQIKRRTTMELINLKFYKYNRYGKNLRK